MKYTLFLDDERYPINPDDKIARSVTEAKNIIDLYGLPEKMSLDHDLGNNETGMDFIKYIIEYHINNKLKWKILYYIHSQNPIGAENMNKLIESFKRWQEEMLK